MKRFLALFFFPSLFLLSSISLAQGAHRISQVVVKGNGIAANISPGSKILVCVVNTGCKTAANIYLDAGLTSPLQNPLTADGSGNYDYYISSGCVDEQISSPGQGTLFVPNVCPFNGQGGGRSGNIIATPQFRMYLQPNAGTQAVAQGAVTGQNGVAPMLQGTINSDLYATGGENNGIANAIASSDCVTAGCYFARTQTSADTENIGALLNTAGDYTHALDSQYGIAGQYFWNTGINTAGSNGNHDANPSTCWWNDQPANTTAKDICRSKYTYDFSPGQYTTGSPKGTKSSNELMYGYGRSIQQLHGATTFAYHVGDAAIDYNYFHYRGGAIQGADEGDEGIILNATEDAPPYGTVTTGGANATVVRSSFNRNGNQGDGYMLIDTQTAVSSGLITAQTAGSGRLLNSITTSDSHAVSSAVAILSGACGTNTSRNAPITATCNITPISGTFSAATNATVCIGDFSQPEQVSVSAVGSNTVTMGMTYSHVTGTPIYQGGGCGLKLALGNGASTPFDANHNLTSYWIAGSQTATSYDVIVVFKSGQNGNVPVPLTTMPVAPLLAITRTSNTVVATPTGPAFPYNQYVAPSAAAITISGATPSDLNGTVTGVTYNPATNQLSWPQTGANESGSGGTMTVVGLNNYFAYCGAETVRVLGATLNNGSGSMSLDGTLQLEPNNCTWTPGDAVTQANSDAVAFIAQRISNVALTPPLANPNVGALLSMSGYGNTGALENEIVNGDVLSTMQGYGGKTLPHTYLQSNGYYNPIFNFTYPPISGGKVFAIGCPPEGCVNSAATYSLFALNGFTSGGTKGSQFTFNPANSSFGMNSPFSDNLSIAALTAIGVAGTGSSPSSPGTSTYGGWFTPIGNPSISISFNSLALGNGTGGDSTGTLGLTQLDAANVTAGVPTPSNFITYINGTTGSTTYSYACTAVTPNGETPAGTSTITNGNATLSSSNYNTPKCFGVPGAQSLNIYRTAGGATQGKIANVPNGNGQNGSPFNDTGIAGDGTSPPSTNTTGKLAVLGTQATVNGKNICLADGTNCPAGTGYPAAGVAVSTGSAWGTSIVASTVCLSNGTNCPYVSGTESIAAATYTSGSCGAGFGLSAPSWWTATSSVTVTYTVFPTTANGLASGLVAVSYNLGAGPQATVCNYTPSSITTTVPLTLVITGRP